MLIEQLRGVLIEAVNSVAVAVINDLAASGAEQPVPTADGGLGVVGPVPNVDETYVKAEYDWRDREARTTAFMQTNSALPLSARLREAAQIADFIRQGITPAEVPNSKMAQGLSAKRAPRSEDEVMDQLKTRPSADNFPGSR